MSVPDSPVGEHDRAILKELGLTYQPARMTDVTQIELKKSAGIQTRFQRLDSDHVEALAQVEAEVLPAVVAFVDSAGDLVIVSGLHRCHSRVVRKDTDVKLIVLGGEYEGLSVSDPRILELAAQFNTKHGKRESNGDFLLKHAVWLVQERGYSVARAAAQQGIKQHVVNNAVKVQRTTATAAKLGANMMLPMQALEAIVKLKSKDLVQAACKIPVKGVGAEGVDFPQYIVPRVLKHTSMDAKLLEIEKLTVEYRSKHSDRDIGINPVAGEERLLGSVTRGDGSAFPGSPADIARKAADRARTQLNKINKPARALSVLDLNDILSTPGSTPKQRQEALKSLRDLRDQITQALDNALVGA